MSVIDAVQDTGTLKTDKLSSIPEETTLNHSIKKNQQQTKSASHHNKIKQAIPNQSHWLNHA